jgi:hypothetical protein
LRAWAAPLDEAVAEVKRACTAAVMAGRTSHSSNPIANELDLLAIEAKAEFVRDVYAPAEWLV